MADIIHQIEVLLRKAVEETDEGRTSAWIAAKLMREHKVRISLPSSVSQAASARSATDDAYPHNHGPSFVKQCVECKLIRPRTSFASDSDICVICVSRHPSTRKVNPSDVAYCSACKTRRFKNQLDDAGRCIQCRHANEGVSLCSVCKTRRFKNQLDYDGRCLQCRHRRICSRCHYAKDGMVDGVCRSCQFDDCEDGECTEYGVLDDEEGPWHGKR